jgi:nucleoside-diphosphate-sugar epimerase
MGIDTMKALITGGAGFFGTVLKQYLSEKGVESIVYDLVPDTDNVNNTVAIQGDLINESQLEACFRNHSPFNVIFHVAAQLAHSVKDKDFLWRSNVDGTRNIVKMAVKYKVPHLVFTSSNCLWGIPMGRKIVETDPPHPVEVYGKSKWEGEKILLHYKDALNITIIRCPTITDAGRLGLLAILFEFIEENRRVYLVGGGENVYQFIYARDLADACLKAYEKTTTTELFNIGSDNVKSLKEVYQYVIEKAGSSSKLVSLPKTPTVLAMKLCYALGLSPLGPYQYKMISEGFVFDTQKIKTMLNWKPTLTNEEMLLKAYVYYKENKKLLQGTQDLSAHKRSAQMGIIKLLKYFS